MLHHAIPCSFPIKYMSQKCLCFQTVQDNSREHRVASFFFKPSQNSTYMGETIAQLRIYQLESLNLSSSSSIRRTSLVAQTIKRLPTMRETQIQSLAQEDLLEKEIATHSSTLAWKIPWTEKTGRLQSMRSQRAGHNLAAKQPQSTIMCTYTILFNSPKKQMRQESLSSFCKNGKPRHRTTNLLLIEEK